MKIKETMLLILLVLFSQSVLAGTVEGFIEKVNEDKTEFYIDQKKYTLTPRTIFSVQGIYGQQLEADVLEVNLLVEVEYKGKKNRKVKELILIAQ
jgi:hypothetical protein